MSKNTKPPGHLKSATRKWFEQIANDYNVESHHLRLLQLACEAWDQCQDAREILRTDGMTFKDQFSNIKAHPAVAIQRESRIHFVRIMRELNLSEEPPESPRAPNLKYGGK